MAAVARLVGCAGTRVDISSKTVSSSDDSHFESPSKRVKRATAVDQDPAGSFMIGSVYGAGTGTHKF